MREIEVLSTTGEAFVVSGIPDDAKITFSSTNPSAPKSLGSGHTLRIYKGSRAENANQLAVFQDVVSFRDKSLTIKKIGKKLWIDNEPKEKW